MARNSVGGTLSGDTPMRCPEPSCWEQDSCGHYSTASGCSSTTAWPTPRSSRRKTEGGRRKGTRSRRALVFPPSAFLLPPYLRSCHHIIASAIERKAAVGTNAAEYGGQSQHSAGREHNRLSK